MRRSLHLALALAALAGCGSGTIGDDDFPDASCLPNEAPGLPEVLAPVAGRIDVVPDELVIQTSAFRDWDADDVHGASEFEIWTEVGGQADVKIWDALIEGAGDLFLPAAWTLRLAGSAEDHTVQPGEGAGQARMVEQFGSPAFGLQVGQSFDP